MSFATTMEAGEFLAILHYEGALPGVAKNQGGLLKPADGGSEAQDGAYPVSRTFQILLEENASNIHYTVIKRSEDGGWQLEKAWRTDADGELVEECLPRLLINPMRPVLTRKAGEFLFNLRLRGQLPGLALSDKGCMECEDVLPGETSDVYPVFRTYRFCFEDKNIGDLLHYTALKPSKTGDWQLQKAWRSNAAGQVIEEYHRLHEKHG